MADYEPNDQFDFFSHIKLTDDGRLLVSSGGALIDELSELADVNITTPNDGDVLIYDSGTNKWINSTLPSSNISNTISFDVLSMFPSSPADSTTYTALPDYAPSSSAFNKRFRLREAKTTFYLNFLYNVTGTLGSGTGSTLRLYNVTKSTSADFTTDFKTNINNQNNFYSVTLSCDADDYLEFRLITPALATNPTGVECGAYITF